MSPTWLVMSDASEEAGQGSGLLVRKHISDLEQPNGLEGVIAPI